MAGIFSNKNLSSRYMLETPKDLNTKIKVKILSIKKNNGQSAGNQIKI